MSIRDKLYPNSPLLNDSAWKRKFYRSVIILAAITFIPIFLLYSLLLKVILAR